MKNLLLLIVLFSFVTTHSSGQKSKVLLGDKVDYEKMSKQDLADTNEDLAQNMDVVLGFGLKLKVAKIENEVEVDQTKKEKNAVRFQIGLKLPQFINTDPPDKIFKIGWDFGVVK